MNKEKNNGKRKLVITMAVALILLVGVTVSYGYIAILGNSKNQEVSVGTGNIHLELDDSDSGNINATLELGQSITKTLKITNKGTKPGKVQINWKNLVNTYNSRSLSYTLETSSNKDTGYTKIEALRENVPVSTEAKEVPLSKEITVPVQSAPIYYRVTITFNDLEDVDQSGDVNATLTTQFSLSEPESLSKKVIAVLNGNVKTSDPELSGSAPRYIYNLYTSYNSYDAIDYSGYEVDNNSYIIYSDQVEFDPITGNGTLSDLKIAKYSDVYSSLNGKYTIDPSTATYDTLSNLYSNNLNKPVSITNNTFYQFAECTANKAMIREAAVQEKYAEADFSGTPGNTSMFGKTSNYITYADAEEYSYDEMRGQFTLKNPKVCKFSECYQNLVGKYVLRTSGSTSNSIVNTPYNVLYKIEATTADSITFRGKGGKANKLIDYSTTGVYKTEDDYGESYYYRGNPSNNYVKFGGFTWRILRVNGNGSLRLIYANNSANEGNSIAFENYNGADIKYMGYMFGGSSESAASANLEDAKNNIYSSAIKKKIDEWYEANLISYSNYLSDTLFCNDREITGTGNGNTFFSAHDRFNTYPSIVSNPTLKCLQKNDRFTVDDEAIGNGDLTYPIGTFTADEEAFAGLIPDGGNSNRATMLTKNNFMGAYSHNNTMTPYYYSTNYRVYFTHLIDISNSYIAALNLLGISPVINIKPEYALKMVGSGTEYDPFIISGAE